MHNFLRKEGWYREEKKIWKEVCEEKSTTGRKYNKKKLVGSIRKQVQKEVYTEIRM